MPRKPLTPCKHPWCKELTNQEYCEEHKPQYQRATAAQRGYDHRWRKARNRYLEEHSLYVKCKEQNRLVKATVIDHVIPHRGDKKLFWDGGNW